MPLTGDSDSLGALAWKRPGVPHASFIGPIARWIMRRITLCHVPCTTGSFVGSIARWVMRHSRTVHAFSGRLPFVLVALCCPTLFLVMLFCHTARAQESRSLNVGRLWYDTNEVLTDDQISWPRDQPGGSSARRAMLAANGIIMGVRRTWTDATGVTRDIQVAQIARFKFSDIELVTPPVPGAFKRTYRNPYPTKVLDDREWTAIQAKNDPVDASLPSDVMVYLHLETWTGIDVERWAYAFANDDHDDYVIMEYRFTNTSGSPRNDVYFGFQAETHGSAYYPGDLWGNYYGATYARFVEGDQQADSLRLWYSWDGDQTSANSSVDTRGRPDGQWGHFQEPQFFGHVVLHADASPDDETDDPTQPWKAGWSQRELAPDLNVAGHEEIYGYLSQGWDTANPGGYAVTVDDHGQEMTVGPFRILDPDLGPSGDASVDINNTTQFDPLTEQEKTALFSFGPYNLGPGDDVRIVTAYVGGSIPYRWAIDAGAAYANGNPQQVPLVPLPYGLPNDRGDYLNPDEYAAMQAFTGGSVVAQEGTTLDRQTKNAVLDLGRPVLFMNAGKAARTWKEGTVRGGRGSFGIPLAPAVPSLEGISENDQVRLRWGDEAQADARAGSIAGYRVYREFNRPAAVDAPTDTTFLLHEELPAGTREYVDTRVTRGEDYYYYVVAVDGDGIESSPYLNRTGVSAQKVMEALAPTRSPGDNWKENVVVVPNPFHIEGAYNYEEDRRLNFLNLPAYANIHVYTMTGDRVQTLEHDSSTGDDDWERQDTFSTLEIVSGVYVYVVQELDGPRGSPTGEQAIGKFVVIK